MSSLGDLDRPARQRVGLLAAIVEGGEAGEPNVRVGQVGAWPQWLEGHSSAFIFRRGRLGSLLKPVASAEQQPVMSGIPNLAQRLERGDRLCKVREGRRRLTVQVKRLANPAHQLGT